MCAREVFFLKTMFQCCPLGVGVCTNRNRAEEREVNILLEQKEKEKLKKCTSGVFFWIVNVCFCKTMGSSDISTVEEPICVASSLRDP